MLGIFAVGSTTGAIAGERQRGTLEILLARPVSTAPLLRDRSGSRSHHASVLVLGPAVLGQMISIVALNVSDQVDLA